MSHFLFTAVEEYAPFLSKYGLVLVPVLIGAVTYWIYSMFIQSGGNKESRKGKTQTSSSDAFLVSRTIVKSTDYDPRVHDEDNHVFQDKVDEFLDSGDAHPMHDEHNTAQVGLITCYILSD